jgi:PAS domain S-box-containing protein
MKEPTNPHVQTLIQRLQRVVKHSSGNREVQLSSEDIRHLAELLEVYQKELETQKKANQELQQAQYVYTQLYDLAPVAYLTLNAQKEIIEANQAACRLFGAKKMQLLGSNFLAWVASEHKETCTGFFRQLSDKNSICEPVLQDRQGNMFYAHIESVAVNSPETDFAEYLTAIINIQAAKAAYEKIKEHNTILQKANAELDRFMYSASHDLRAPLTSVMGVVNVARMETQETQTITYLNFIDKSIRKLENFVQDMINLSRNSTLELKNEPIKIRELVSGIFDELQYVEHTRIIRKIIEVDAHVELNSDKARLSIILTNLISNAIKYHNLAQPEPFISITILVEKHQATFTVQDNGHGITQNHLDKIFDKFYRATTASKGSGLGLFIVKETLEKMQGKIHVYSKIGEGSTFTFTVPNHPLNE